MRLYWEVGRRAFQRMLAYRTANVAGFLTNVVFGYLRAAILTAVYAGQSEIGGYSLRDVVAYSWVTQALIMVVLLWGSYDIEQTIRTGDVVSDLSKPFSYLGFWLARDYGRALYHLLFRGAPVVLIAMLTFRLQLPTSPVTWLLFAVSMTLGVAVSFAWRFLVQLTAFWTTDTRGLGGVANAVSTFFSGLVVPLYFLPPLWRDVSLALPFVGVLQTPADIFVGRLQGADVLPALALQVFWTVVMLAFCQLAVQAATRKVVLQGG